MASSDMKICSLCYEDDDDGSFTDAVEWCIECEVFLCTDCGKHHKKSRTSKDHKTMSTEDYHELPKFMQEISNQCRDHKKKFDLYCSFHACPCCVTCITDTHQQCQEMKSLSDVLEQVKSSASVQLLENDLKDMKEIFEEITKHLNSRMETSSIQTQKAAENIKSMRKSIDDYLNKIEKDILEDLESKQSKLKSKINTLLQQLTQRANEISQLQSEFSKMTQYATDLQMYVGLGEIEKTTSQAAEYIEDLKSGGQFDENYIEVTISSEVQSILKDVKSFGDININTSPCSLQVKTGRKNQAQYLVPTISIIEKIKPSMLRQLTMPEESDYLSVKYLDIIACRILPDGKYLILDSDSLSSHLLLFGNDGIFMRDVKTLTGYSSDICFVKADTVAVTLGSSKEKKMTALVDIESKKIIKKIRLSHFCYGLASDGQIMVVGGNEKSTIVNLNDMSETILEGVKAYCVALFKGNIYGTTVDEVYCIESSGTHLWTFKHHDIGIPGKLALDKNCCVYIACKNNNRIVVVSHDGQTCKTILSEANGIKSPKAIDINIETGTMIVSSQISIDSGDSDCKYNHKAFVYKL
ncbi:uncharacterized protein LOC127698800 [Mytilus californianus]|uniref:uncharacterized protein LOC127698800 n=1 Tax=Mytilus californianus TaxID=6549 RepID=UPI002245B9CB|nr:uncharacterized protein LOC127698800 [Mytilus californianus]XP_052058440.1 uncharacterized protein LOC127698800 [Mytilus californianus]XP_052058442.1 uncharacterized protein LOC127698800 [Mytilus californianus]